MSEILIIRRLLAGRPLQNLLAVIVMAASVALSVGMLLMSAGLHDSLVQAGKNFPMVMGAKGSPNQLVLNTVFLKDQPIGNFSYTKVLELRNNTNVEQAVPLGFGDNYKGFRIVGTEKEIFTFHGIEKDRKNWLQLSEGKFFQQPFEAVIGAETAAKTGLKVGDVFASVHGVASSANSRKHEEQYKVVGILKPVQGPYDSAIFVSMESIWHQHNHVSLRHAGNEQREVTSVLIRPAGYAQSLQLAAQYNKDRDVQVIFPSKTIIELFSVIGNIEKVLQVFTAAVLLLSLLIIGSSLYWFVVGSVYEQGIMRSLGATAQQIMYLYFKLGMTLVGVGTLLGVALGHSGFQAISYLLQDKVGLYMQAGLVKEEIILVAAILLFGAVCSIIPAYLASRKDIAEIL